jgi:hypothetical protein
MKTLSFIIAASGTTLSFFFIANTTAQNESNTEISQQHKAPDYLFPVTIKNRVGFIDSLGRLAIPAVYESCQEFSEGRCPVRIHGLYGFINTLGDWMIPAQYDFALPFAEGRAVVFVGSNPVVINSAGDKILDIHYADISPFENGIAYVTTASRKVGVINRSGNLIVDTLYQYIGGFRQGLAIAEGIGHNVYPQEGEIKNVRITIIDTLGNVIVPYGKYYEIGRAGDDYFEARVNDSDEHKPIVTVLLNRKGDITYTFKRGELNYSNAQVSCGIFRITRSKKPRDINSENYDVYMTPTGKEIFRNKKAEYGEDFAENFAFWRDESRNVYMINRKGKIVGEFDDLHDPGFQNGRAVVAKDGLWGIIDTTANFILQPKFDGIHSDGVKGEYLVFKEPGYSYTDEHPEAKYGIADIKGNIIIPETFHEFDRRGFYHGLLKTWKGGNIAFYNKDGRIVWQEETVSNKPYPRNIDHLQRGYFYVSGPSTGHGGGYGAPAPQAIGTFDLFSKETLTVKVIPDEEKIIEEKLKGLKVCIANATDDTIIFNAQDSRLYMKTQALTADGTWQDIEYLPSSWCGNSYHAVELPGNHYWELSTLEYEGSIKTKLRIELTYVDPTDTLGQHFQLRHREHYYRRRKELKIYSNEFEGTINPGQLWRRPEYYPNGIMDPYNN